jgi:predicted Fe-Mo cluster-binding NifX family protein
MRVCIPIAKELGLQSRVSPHFGSAPLFMLVESETRAYQVRDGPRPSRDLGVPPAFDAILAERAEAYVVARIGAGAMRHLQEAGARVYGTDLRTVVEVLDALAGGTLTLLTPDSPLVHDQGRGGGGQGRGLMRRHRHRGAQA